ncbi:MAG: KH domain-containing protein [bacterium]|nr:KH domain-containing protein [bacterium]
MKKALEYILSQIVDEPEKVEVKEQEEEGMINFAITVAPADMGKIIGKNGKVIRAIRNVIKISAIKQNKKINISLVETAETTTP